MKREKTAETKRKSSPRIKRNRTIAAGLAVLIGTFIWYSFLGPGSKVVVPSLAGMSVKQATSELEDLGLSLQVGTEEFSEEVPDGKIIASDPAGGGRIAPTGTVKVTVSKGKERYDIPNLAGLTIDAAETALTKRKLLIGQSIEEFSSEVPKGYIIRTSPKVGEKVKRDTTVDLVISAGVEQISLSDYKGKSGEQALNELNDAGFEVKTNYVFNEDLPIGAVISQSPSTGQAPKGSTITLLVSKGSEFVFIPNLFGMAESKAVTTLKSLELKVTVKKVGTKKVKVVTNIAPKVGSKVKRGSTVTITVG